MLRVSLLRIPLVFALSIAWFAEDALAVPRGYWQPGGYEARIGSPYYYSVPVYGWSTATPRPGWPAGMLRTPGIPTGSHHGCACYGTPAFAGGRAVSPAWSGHRPVGSSGYGYWGYGTAASDPYTRHFGPGYYRHAEHGHFRFPYYSYRRPWYFPGAPVFNRDTNFAW